MLTKWRMLQMLAVILIGILAYLDITGIIHIPEVFVFSFVVIGLTSLIVIKIIRAIRSPL
ncbi:hypothetical protein ACFPU1_12760 [Thalassorhabdus alkalitolerans]|uniref:Uncharacterized protein n=1 Tax=Thalassorhabdus alkalitolerans TaxID=2282697 RepID=A0ABW0YQB9_9BACI